MTDIEKFLTASTEDLTDENEARDKQVIEDILNVVFGGAE